MNPEREAGGDGDGDSVAEALAACLAARAEGVVLAVRVTPNASRTEWRGFRNGRVQVRLRAPPVEGRANEALLEWIGEEFGLRSREVVLLRGDRSREKSVLLGGLSLDSALERLRARALSE